MTIIRMIIISIIILNVKLVIRILNTAAVDKQLRDHGSSSRAWSMAISEESSLTGGVYQDITLHGRNVKSIAARYPCMSISISLVIDD